MIYIIVLLIIAIVVMAININYKNHCIDDLETRIKRLKIAFNIELKEFIEELKDAQSYDLSASREYMTRRIINEKIEEINKKELSTSDQTEIR